MSSSETCVVAAETICAEIEVGNMKLSRGLLGQAYLDVTSPSVAVAKGLFRLRDKDCRAWLSAFLFKKVTLLPNSRQMDRIVQLLEGLALGRKTAQINDPALLEVIEGEPLISVVLEYMENRQRHESSMQELKTKLTEVAQGLGLVGKKRYPKSANVLSRRLKEFASVFQLLDISVTIWRSNGAQVVIERLDGSDELPSSESSIIKPNDEKPLRHVDGNHELMQFLADKRRSLNTKIESQISHD